MLVRVPNPGVSASVCDTCAPAPAVVFKTSRKIFRFISIASEIESERRCPMDGAAYLCVGSLSEHASIKDVFLSRNK